MLPLKLPVKLLAIIVPLEDILLAVIEVKLPVEATDAPMLVPLIVPPAIVAFPVDTLLPLKELVIAVAVTVPRVEVPNTVKVPAS